MPPHFAIPLPQHGAIEDPVHAPFDVTSGFAGQWTLAPLVQDCLEAIPNGQRFYLGQREFAPPGTNVIVDVGKICMLGRETHGDLFLDIPFKDNAKSLVWHCRLVAVDFHSQVRDFGTPISRGPRLVARRAN